jgi:FkbM family methyltransferase
MMAIHKNIIEPVTVEVTTKDRGRMILELDDEMQYTMYYNLFEAQYDKVMSVLLPGSDITMDVGGNIGQYALLFAQFSKKVYTFEPMPKMIERLQKHIAMNHLESKITLIPKALSNKTGILKFSLPKAANSGTASTILGSSGNLEDIIEVESITLDEFLAKENISGSIDLIKMDIEGAEFFALQGMKNMLDSGMKPIFILEINDMMMGLAGYSSKDIRNYLGEWGYKAFQITKKGLRGPMNPIPPACENYCFLTNDRIELPKINALIYQ